MIENTLFYHLNYYLWLHFCFSITWVITYDWKSSSKCLVIIRLKMFCITWIIIWLEMYLYHLSYYLTLDILLLSPVLSYTTENILFSITWITIFDWKPPPNLNYNLLLKTFCSLLPEITFMNGNLFPLLPELLFMIGNILPLISWLNLILPLIYDLKHFVLQTELTSKPEIYS